jgi:tetratricopeptide (TPR) repeat protein
LSNYRYNKGVGNLVTFDPTQAVLNLTKAIFLFPSESSFYYIRAEAFLQMFDFYSAIQDYRRFLLINQRSKVSKFVKRKLNFALYTLGQILLDERQFIDAEKLFSLTQLIELDSDSMVLRR